MRSHDGTPKVQVPLERRSVESLSGRLRRRVRCEPWEDPNWRSWEQASALGLVAEPSELRKHTEIMTTGRPVDRSPWRLFHARQSPGLVPGARMLQALNKGLLNRIQSPSPAPAIWGSCLTLTPLPRRTPPLLEGPHWASGCPAHKPRRAGSRALRGPVTVTSPGRWLVSAERVGSASLWEGNCQLFFPHGRPQDSSHRPELARLCGHPEIEQTVSTRCSSHQVHTHTHLSGVN